MKKYNHAVIYNGTFYPANTPIEEVKTAPVEASANGSDKKPTKKGGGKNDNRTN